MKPLVLFIDTVCSKPYSAKVLDSEPLGGTEATVTRIAEGLKSTYDVIVAQHNRTIDETTSGVLYTSLGILESKIRPRAVVALRSPLTIPLTYERWRDAKQLLWCHDLVTKDLLLNARILNDCKVTIVTVSDFHKQNISSLFLTNTEYDGRANVTVKRVYNPIDDNLRPDDTERDNSKMVFLSSPHKGLDLTLEYFTRLRQTRPDLKLHVANPGYYKGKPIDIPGVVNLGELTHDQVIKNLRDAMCLFYPNTVFPETFGLVLAEANAVDTPVLCHRFGAAAEVLGDIQPIDCRDFDKVNERLIALQFNRGAFAMADLTPFRLTNVINEWSKLL